jgi:hypothetical protein
MDEEAEAEAEAGNAAEAFDALRAEVARLGRAVEMLPAVWEKKIRAPDYSPDLGRILRAQNTIANHLATIEAHPALQLTPKQHAEAVAQAGNGLMEAAAGQLNTAVGKLNTAVGQVEEKRDQLAHLVDGAHTRQSQIQRLWWTGGIALIVGLLLSPIVSGVLPFGVNTRVAALVMEMNRVDAGMALVRAANPQDWNNLAFDWNLITGTAANAKAVADCQSLATAKGGFPCMITVPAKLK